MRTLPALIVLSGKDEERLKERAGQLLEHVREGGVTEADLADVAYTLQVGRQAMEQRLALTARSLQELQEKLSGYLQGALDQLEDVYIGEASAKNALADFSNDQGVKQLYQGWLQAGMHSKVLQLWVNGADLDWESLQSGRPRRISLPTYPFAQKRYWIEARKRIGTNVASQFDQEPYETPLLAVKWQSVTGASDTVSPTNTKVALLVNATETQQRIWQEHFRSLQVLAADSAISVEDIAQRIRGIPTIDPHVIWLAPPTNISPVSDETLIQAQEVGVIGLYRLIKTLLSLGYGKKSLAVCAITWQSVTVESDEQIDPTHAGIHGFVSSLAKEYPNWRISLFDLSLQDRQNLLTQTCGALLTVAAGRGAQVRAHRSGQWYRRVLLPVVPMQRCPAAFREGGVYLVIGGAGGIGEAFTEYLIQNYHAHVIWIGRRPMNQVIGASIKRLSKLGPSPHYLQADATNREALDNVRAQIFAAHGAIHGVIHAAVVLADKNLPQLDELSFRAVLASKVDVSVRLIQVFGESHLDFVLFFSSAQSFAASAGQSNYAAGCTFMDAFASRLASQDSGGYVAKVMNWGYWGGVGVAADDVYRTRMAKHGLGSIETSEGVLALEQLMASDSAQMAFLKAKRSALVLITNVQENALPSGSESGPNNIGQDAVALQELMTPFVGGITLQTRSAVASSAGKLNRSIMQRRKSWRLWPMC